MKNLFKKLVIVLYLILISFSFSSCSKIPTFDLKDKDDYSDYSSYNLDSIFNMYNKEEESYAVYLYKESCEGCNDIKNSILGYINEYDKNEDKNLLKIYLYNSVNLKVEGANYLSASGLTLDEVISKMNDKENTINSIENTILSYTPALYVINNGALHEFRMGSEDVAKVVFTLSEYKNSSFSYLTSLNYDDFNKYNLLDLNNFYSQDETKYGIYLFFKTCPYCLKTKKDLFSYMLDENKMKEFPIYFYDIKSKNEEEGIKNRGLFKSNSLNYSVSELINIMKENSVNKLEDTYLDSVPSLYIVNENTFYDLKLGKSDITVYLNL